MRFFKYRPRRWTQALATLLVLLGVASCGREAPSFAPGDITVVSTPPGAAILFDGQDTGEVTPHTFAGLYAARYVISVIMPDFVSTPGDIPVDLAPLDDITLAFALSKTALLITSQPAGARIIIDGTDTGLVTPATVANLAPGAVDVSLALDTYVVSPPSFTVEVIEDSVLTVPAETFALRSQRTVVLEGFANINCGPCPQLTDNLLAMRAKPEFTADRVLYIEYAVSWPNFSDPLYQYNPTENSDRFTNYVVLGAPGLFTDGVKRTDALDAVAMEASVTAGLLIDPGFRIDLSADFSNPQIPVAVTLQPDRDVDLTGYNLFVALFEQEIDFNERGLTPGTNGQTVFHNVFRDRVDTPPALGQLTAGTPQVYDVTLARSDWPLDNLAVMALVQHGTDYTIIQAGSYGELEKTGGNPR